MDWLKNLFKKQNTAKHKDEFFEEAPKQPQDTQESPDERFNELLPEQGAASSYESPACRTIAFVDVETTGLLRYDRVVSFGAIIMEIEGPLNGPSKSQAVHLIFDPIRKSHPRAEAIHGYDDWTLRHQDRFSKWAKDLHEILSRADLVIAHNAEFDFRFINREFELCGMSSPIKAGYCTMEEFRKRWPGVKSSLSFIASVCKFEDQGQHHSALKDAWIAMQVYFLLNGLMVQGSFSQTANPFPTNLREVPKRPEGPLPRRNNKRRQEEAQNL